MDNQNKQATMLKDAAIALNYGWNIPADARIQVKIPKFILNQLDKLYPNANRSKIITKAIINEILRNKYNFKNIDLLEMMKEEQQGLDDMFSYLEDRDSK